MKLFKAKIWKPVDIGLFKWCNILFGMIIGAYVSGFVKEYVWAFVIAVILLAIKPTVAYFKNDAAPTK